MHTCKIKIINDNAVIPKKASAGAGAFDLTVSSIKKESENSFLVGLGIALQPEPGYRIRIIPRSSLTKTNWVLQNSPALGDEDYTGEYFLRFKGIPTSLEAFNMTVYEEGTILYGNEVEESLFMKYDKFPYKVGERCAQMYIDKEIPNEFKVVKELTKTERGDGKFGSTGR